MKRIIQSRFFGAKIWRLLAVIVLLAGSLAAQQQVELSPALLDKVPADLREQAAVHLRLTPAAQETLLKASAEALRRLIIFYLSYQPSATEFILDHLPKEPAPQTRAAIVSSIPRRAHFANNVRTRPMLREMVLSDKDTGVVLAALETLRLLEMQSFGPLLDRRIQSEIAAGNKEFIKSVAEEQERWISLQRGTMLPAFMRTPPPIFSLKPVNQPVRIVAFGDFGRGKPDQKRVADAILGEHKKNRFNFGITTGDNFYPGGMESLTDPRWKTYWEDLYTPLGIKFYATLGNHDWGLQDSPAAEILYSARSESWRMPAPYYTYTAGPIQFFALDTTVVSQKQLLWLKDELAKSNARWKIVYSHHPIFSPGSHGDTKDLVDRLWPIVKGQIDVHIAGHDHILAHLRAQDGVEFFVTGGGGASNYTVNENDSRSLFARPVYGFLTVQATLRELLFRFVGAEGQELYTYTMNKSQ